ncbi:MAG: recombinase RecD [Pedosphaera sp.]|nr:recombinase RecD [Pedosphaera sp.]
MSQRQVVEKFGWQFRLRDKVIQTGNNYDKDVFNGDIGQIVKIDLVEREVMVRFDQWEVLYDFDELDEVSLACATDISLPFRICRLTLVAGLEDFSRDLWQKFSVLSFRSRTKPG